MNSIYLRHAFVEHRRVSDPDPWQFRPPRAGGGLLQARDLD